MKPTERLAIPAWGTPPRTIEDWSAALGEGCVVDKEPDGSAWIEVASSGLRGFAIFEGRAVVAIDFEIDADDPAAALDRLAIAAGSLGWELHDEDGEDED